MNIVESLLRVALLGSAWVLYLLLGLSVLSITAMIERAVFFRRHTRGIEMLRDAVRRALTDGDLEVALQALDASRTIHARVLVKALGWRRGGPEAVSDAVESELAEARRELERGSGLLGTLGNNAPFIGLLGTVIGVIEAFNHLGSDAARSGAMGNVMSGIAEALVATGVGLFVALPAVVAYNVVQARIADVESDTVALSKLFTAFLKSEEQSPREPAKNASQKSTNGHGALKSAPAAGE